MGMNLFSIGGLYFTPGDKKGIGATWGISSDAPDRIQILIIKLGGIIEKREISINSILKIEACDRIGKGKHTCVKLILNSGMEHIMDAKNVQRASEAVRFLLSLSTI